MATEISQILSFIFTSSESFMCVAGMVKKFEIYRTRLRDPLIGAPNLSNFVFLSYLLILQIYLSRFKQLKSLICGVLV